ncbi:Aromatic-ring hydroxylase-like protein [Macrophomina phaseolina MS6]|uniref:Aromatic-ring hydroxylase-like protein n=1 Tax=Macrophomina phaseolina (strain MS6) TaxID=1126212 RepID=K2SQ61_MACPH|nr:Aromatic-ring hydroxylase-like protein [Macrophomina phaseolina MS6]
MGSNEVSYQTQQVPLASIGGPLPSTIIPEDVDHASIAARAVEQLHSLDASALKDDAIWRDQVALTGTYRTFYGSQNVQLAWGELTDANRPQGFALITGSSLVVRPSPELHWVQAMFVFKLSPEGRKQKYCSGFVRIIPVGEDWKIWIISTLLEDIEGYGTSDQLEALSPEQSEKEKTADGISSSNDRFDVVIVGGGQAGISTASRLKALGISHVVLDRNTEVGGNWLTRYKSFTLHTSKSLSDLPYGGGFGKEAPYFPTANDIADGYKRFVERFGLNIWLSCVATKASWDSNEEEWTIELSHSEPTSQSDTNGDDGTTPTTTRTRTLHAPHLIFAMGGGGQVPSLPSIPNAHLFRGQTLHSVTYTTATPWRGQRGVIIGTANTAHDVSADMVAAGLASVTLVQRGRTPVMPESFFRERFDPLYHEGADIPLTDRIMEAAPLPVTQKMLNAGIKVSARRIPEYFEGLEKAGFDVEREIDLCHVLYERMGGHYYDVGASRLIVDGEVKVKKGVVESFTEKGLRFADGSDLEADVIVYATGFVGNMRHAAAEIVGEEVGGRLEDFWGVDAEGELRGACKPMLGQKNVWYIGGDMRFARYHSRNLALQIKADLEGETLDVYRKTPGE